MDHPVLEPASEGPGGLKPSPGQTARRAAAWAADRFFSGFIWGFSFMLGLWAFGTLVGWR